jgi:RNase P/RNase MRP subunit p30
VRKAISVAQEHHINVVLSSGARSFEMIRSPSEISALATTLGMRHEDSIRGVSSLPSSIIAENLRKRAPEYVEEDVKIVLPSRR